MTIPAYLQRPPEDSGTTVGTLEPQKSSGQVVSWIIEGDPGVVELVKRLFPGSVSRGRGYCKFPATKRNAESLNWLMLRFPLDIKDKAAWEYSYQGAVDHALRIRVFNERPQKTEAPPQFIGELKDFQKEGLSYLLGTERALLADGMGLGKTIQALAFLAAKNAYPAIIVVQPHLIKNWEYEIRRFLKLPGTDEIDGQMTLDGIEPRQPVHVLKGLTPYELPPANIYIAHYLILRGWKQVLQDYRFRAVIFD